MSAPLGPETVHMSLSHAKTADRPSEETELIARAVRRDEAAIRLIRQRHNRRLYRIARAVLRNEAEAEDAVQEGYIRAFSALAGFRGESSLATWLSRIVLNEALHRARKLQRDASLIKT